VPIDLGYIYVRKHILMVAAVKWTCELNWVECLMMVLALHSHVRIMNVPLVYVM
jgi:hypothetical protein